MLYLLILVVGELAELLEWLAEEELEWLAEGLLALLAEELEGSLGLEPYDKKSPGAY